MLDTRTRLELHLHQLEERLVEMDAKFEHNIAAMNELLQKNLKYRRLHVLGPHTSHPESPHTNLTPRYLKHLA